MSLPQNKTSGQILNSGVRLGIDMGGTLTKFLILDDGEKRAVRDFLSYSCMVQARNAYRQR